MKVGLPYAVASSLLFREMTSGDLLNKFEREVRRFTAPELPDELERDDHIFNAAVTAWSVVEWVWVEREYAFAGQFANKGPTSRMSVPKRLATRFFEILVMSTSTAE